MHGTPALPSRHPVPDWRPLVTVNLAMSLDGRIAARGGRTLVLSDDEDRRRVHRMRAEHDAILVGIGTVLADDPGLIVRADLYPEGADRHPVRVVLDSRHRTPVTARIASGDPPTILYCARPGVAKPTVLQSLRGLEVVGCPEDETRRVDLSAALADLRRRGITSLMVEGGARVIGSFARLGFIDRLSIFIAPVIVGAGAPGMVEDEAATGGGWLHGFEVVASASRPTGVTVHLAPHTAPR